MGGDDENDANGEEHEWSAYYDDEGQLYYYNSVTGESSWDAPEKFNPPPPQDDEGGEGEAAEEAAEEVAEDTKAEDEGDLDDQAEGSRSVTASPIQEPPVDDPMEMETETEPAEPNEEQPAEAATEEPPAQSGPWAAYQDDSGQTYYYNQETGETQWEKPEGFDDGADETTPVSPPREGTPPPSSPVAEDFPEDEEPTKQQQEEAEMQQEPEPEPEPQIDPAQKRLEDAEKALNKSDAIMEPGCLDNVGELLSSLGGQEGGQKAMQALIKSFHGQTAICGLLAVWLTNLKSAAADDKDAENQSASEVRETVQDVVNRIAKERFTKSGGDNIFKLKRSEVVFLEEMMDSERWRKLLIDLSAANRDSTLLNYCLSSISKRGHHREIARRINQSDHFAVYTAMLASEFGVVGNIASGAQADADSSMGLQELVADLRRTCTSTSYTYLYAIELLRYLVATAREKAESQEHSTQLQQAIRKWERLREELESAMVDPSMSSSTAGSSTLFRKRRLDVALTVSELHQRQRRRMNPTVPLNGGGGEHPNGGRHDLETALGRLLRRNAGSMPLDDYTLDKLLPREGENGTKVGKLMLDFPLVIKVLLGHLFKPGSSRVPSMLTRTKCARLVALAVMEAEATSRAESGDSKVMDEEERSAEEERVKGMLLTGSQLCELLENMVSFMVTSDENNDDPNPSAGVKLSKLGLTSSPIAQGILMWVRELVFGPEFVSSASYPTLSSSILSLLRVISLKHPFTRPDAVEVTLAFLGHRNSEVSYKRMSELKEQCLRLLLALLVKGEVTAILGNLTTRLKKQGASEIDASLVRYFVGGLLDVMAPPYSPIAKKSLKAFLSAPRCIEALNSTYFTEQNKTKFRLLVKDLKLNDSRFAI